MIFIAKSVSRTIIKNNPGADRPVWFWIRIPKENHGYPLERRHGLGPIESPTL